MDCRCGCHQLGCCPAIWIVRSVVISFGTKVLSYGPLVCGVHQLGPGPAKCSVSVVVTSLGPGPAIWIVSVVISWVQVLPYGL